MSYGTVKVDTIIYTSGGLDATAAVSGYYFANAESKYFGLVKIGKDQVIDYAKRKNQSLEYITKWLQPVID